MSRIGIVTVLYNSENVLSDFFDSLEKQTYKDFVLYVIDNKSPDNSLITAKSLASTHNFKTKFFAEEKNWGVAKGNNIGIINALADNCQYVLLSNNDVVLHETTIENLLRGLLTMQVKIAVPKIYFYDSNRFYSTGGCFSKFKALTPHRGYNCVDHGQYDSCDIVEYAPTCFMLIDASVFYEVGLMDERYFVYYDDSDFIWRATKRHKNKIAYISNASLEHKESYSTGGGQSDFAIYYSGRNAIYFANKNYSLGFRILAFIFQILHTYLRKPFICQKDKVGVAKKALWDGFKMCRYHL